MSEFAQHFQHATRPIDRWGEPAPSNAWYAHDWTRQSHRWPSAFGWLATGLLMLWTALATSYIVLESDNGATEREAEMQLRSAYETRISRLRSEIDSINGKLMLNQDSFDSKLEALRRRQKHLESRQNKLSDLIDEAAHPAIQTAAVIGAGDMVPGQARELRLAFTPRPSIAAPIAHDRASAARIASNADDGTFAALATNPADHALVRLSRAQDRLEASQHDTLEALEARAAAASRAYHAILSELGLEPSETTAARTEEPASNAGMGGPYVPMLLDQNRPRDAFEGRLSRVRDLIFTSADLYENLQQVPVRAPIAGKRQITSGFGMRRDPFYGSMALHSGLDFRARRGEPVIATAEGEVTFAANAGGYGKLVELTHANGFVSRYAHLSAIQVRPGQQVRAGQRIGRVGSTGRSTGPHLHYELKLDGKPINPRRFLAAADLLAQARLAPQAKESAPE